MQKRKKPLFALALALWGFSSCSQDASDVQGSATGGEPVTLSLRAEISVDDPSLRAIDYKLGTNGKGQLVPMPQFEDKQIVEVHTILKSSRSGSVPVAKTLKWRYDAAKKKLVLAPTDKDSSKDANNIVVSDFNNDGGTKWYISGLLGGTLQAGSTQVSFSGTRELASVDGNVGDIVGSLNVPYAFPWTELVIDKLESPDRDARNSHLYADVPSEASPKFKPLGSLIAYKLGNEQTAGAYSFTPSGFTVRSNSFGDQGTFELNTSLPTQGSPMVLPSWTETRSSLIYRFAPSQSPGTIAHKGRSAKTYYAWVMPHKTQPAVVSTRVMLKGESSRSEEDKDFKHYTKAWFTDYRVKSSGLVQGRVQQLNANATRPLYLPIEYVTDYNLAGGEGLTYTTSNMNPQPAGVLGDLRFADSHSNDQSGYYNWYKVMGIHHSTFNPQSRNLQTEIDKKFGANTYFIPELDHWLGVWPSTDALLIRGSESLNRNEYFQVGFGDDNFRGAFRSDYSRSYTALDATSDAFCYAIRFKGHPSASSESTMSVSWGYDSATGRTKSTSYEYVGDDLWKCAYRFRRVGGSLAWNDSPSRNAHLTHQLVIDVVYLGEAPTTLADISNSAWWDGQEKVTRTFSVPGYIAGSSSVSGSLGYRGNSAKYWTSSQGDASRALYMSLLVTGLSYHYGNSQNFYGHPVRLFSRLN